LRRAGYLSLDHAEFLELLGSRPSSRRPAIYQKCRGRLAEAHRDFWDARPRDIERGVAGVGKFEGYFAMFRKFVLPLAHPRERVLDLLNPRGPGERERFYNEVWDNRRWRWIFHVFFSRAAMGALGRDPEFFRYVEGSVADRILARTRHALAVLDPSENPYLHWILAGTHGAVLPEALTEQNFPIIREALEEDRFKIFQGPLEKLLEEQPDRRFDAYNLSDIFEYMSVENTVALLERIVRASDPGARLAYWNMLAPRSRPESMAGRLLSHDEEAAGLFAADRAFFYSRFVIEEVVS
jgi:S-adenosylmethionine-diacylglycerol 3-amino-3-carboxypropyl transferase